MAAEKGVSMPRVGGSSGPQPWIEPRVVTGAVVKGGNMGQWCQDYALSLAVSVGGLAAAGAAWVPLAPRAGWDRGIQGVPWIAEPSEGRAGTGPIAEPKEKLK